MAGDQWDRRVCDGDCGWPEYPAVSCAAGGVVEASCGARDVLLSRVEEEVMVDGRRYTVACCQYPGVAPSTEYLTEFPRDAVRDMDFQPCGFALLKVRSV